MARARSRTARALGVPVACLVVLAGCSVGPSERPPVAVRGDTVLAVPDAPPTTDPPAPDTLPEPDPQNTALQFFDCGADIAPELVTPAPAGRALSIGCGELEVPADPADPGLGDVSVGVLRAGLAGAPTNLPPLLVLGDSAAGGSFLEAAELARRASPALLARYSLIGMDRRGAGIDTLDCAPDDARAALVDADPAAASANDLDELLEPAQAVVQECTIDLDSTLGSYRSAAVASDVEVLRTALGVARLSAIGTGDGAGGLAVWAAASPGTVGRLVLDGPPAPGIDEPARSEARAAASEAAFDAFAVACTAQPGCALGPSPRAAVTRIVAALHAQPLAAADGRRLTAGSALLAIRSDLGEPRNWPALTTALAAAAAGDAGPLLDRLTLPLRRFDGALATACNDTRARLATGQIADLAARWTQSYPLFGGSLALALVGCAPWPTGGTSAPPVSPEPAPPVLVLGTAADPRQPLDGARSAAGALPSARFLSWQGTGTGAYPRTACVTSVVDAMLVDGTVPGPDTLCPP